VVNGARTCSAIIRTSTVGKGYIKGALGGRKDSFVGNESAVEDW
jgi:hypothetical protein